MKILHLIHSLNPKGGGIAASLKEIPSHEATILCLDDPSSLFLKNYTQKIIALGPSYGHYGYTSTLICWLNQNLKQFNAAVIHGLWQFHGLGFLLCKKPKNFPYYIFFHGMLDPWFNQHNWLKKIKKNFYWHIIEHHLIQNSKGLFFTAKQEKIKTDPLLTPYQKPCHIVNYGINDPNIDHNTIITDFFEKYPQLKHKKILLFLSRIHPKKGVDMLIKAWNHFWEKNENKNESWLLLIVGPHTDKESSYYKHLNTIAQKSTKPVAFISFLEGSTKWAALAASQFFILPSHQENFGMAVVEALAAKTPVLISNAIDIWEIIAAEKAGLIKPDTISGTEKLIEEAVTMNDENYRLLKENTLNCFHRHFNLNLTKNTLHETIKRDLETSLSTKI